MTSLIQYLNSFTYLTDTDKKEFLNLATFEIKNSGDLLITQGKACDKIYFITKGIVRSYYNTYKGETNTYCITFPENFITAYSSYILGIPNHENMECLTDIQCFSFHKNELETLAQKNTNWLRFQKDMAEMQYIELENRIIQLQNVSAKDRYLMLLKKHPEFVLNIPVQYISSYLGITTRHFSRIRKEISLSDKCPTT